MATKTSAPDSAASIDPRGEEIVLRYIGAPDAHGAAPSRDLQGSDLNRIAYVRELRIREAKHAAFRRAQDDDRPQPDLKLPGVANAEALGAIADELVGSGSYERVQTSEPAATAEKPEA